MKIKPFELERYFAKYEFSAPYLLSPSDCEPLTLKELVKLSDVKTRKVWDELWLGYTESQGYPKLREEVSKLYENIKPENVLEVVPEEGIFITMNVLLSREDHVISTFPGYQSLYEIANSLGAEVTKWVPEERENNWYFNVDFLKKSLKKNTKLIVVNFPHNPTGAMVSSKDFLEIINLARKRGIYVFSDEMYRFLEYDGRGCLPSAADVYENAISLFGVSKTFGLAGLRVGWLTTQNIDLIKKFQIFKDYTTICGSAPSEILALMALRVKERIVRRNLEIIKDNLKLLDAFFKRHGDKFFWIRPKAGTIGFPRLLLKKDIGEFCRDVVSQKGVMVLPSGVYGYKGNNFRLGFGRKNMPQALKSFEEYLRENY
jgi:aspartate/methionine/tyrosine aminotransferase